MRNLRSDAAGGEAGAGRLGRMLSLHVDHQQPQDQQPRTYSGVFAGGANSLHSRQHLPDSADELLRRVFGKYRLGRLRDLFNDGQWFVAGIVLLASILIPFFKLLGLFFLVITTKLRSARGRQQRTWIYKIIAVIGPWAMLDVFLLSILVALVKLQQIATVLPGRGLLAFTGVVLLTILASASFDPRLIWEETEQAS